MLEVKAGKERLRVVDSITTQFTKLEIKEHYFDIHKSIIDVKIACYEMVMVVEQNINISENKTR